MNEILMFFQCFVCNHVKKCNAYMISFFANYHEIAKSKNALIHQHDTLQYLL